MTRTTEDGRPIIKDTDCGPMTRELGLMLGHLLLHEHNGTYTFPPREQLMKVFADKLALDGHKNADGTTTITLIAQDKKFQEELGIKPTLVN